MHSHIKAWTDTHTLNATIRLSCSRLDLTGTGGGISESCSGILCSSHFTSIGPITDLDERCRGIVCKCKSGSFSIKALFLLIKKL